MGKISTSDHPGELKITKGSGNVFADLGSAAEEAQNLLLRSQTMMAVESWYQASGMTQAAASKQLGVTQPKLNLLLKGKIDEFSLDALVNMVSRAGLKVELTIKAPAERRAPKVRLEAGTAKVSPKKPAVLTSVSPKFLGR